MPIRDTPPFRADHVGSLLSPPELMQARADLKCGLCSTEEGNRLTIDEEPAKLELVVEVARELWGG